MPSHFRFPMETRYRHDQAGHRHLVTPASAFEAQGVTLADPVLSRSGVRADGSVVIAMPADLVRQDGEGHCCLLYALPTAGQADLPARLPRPSDTERLAHCRLAERQGGADGMLVQGETGQVRGNAILPLRVRRLQSGYWAFWGSVARSASAPVRECMVAA